MNWKEYSKLRSIARKRIERASAAGKMEYTYIPSVKEVKVTGNPEMFLAQVKQFLSSGQMLSTVKKTDTIIPPVKFPPAPKVQKPTDAAKIARRREQNRRSKAKRAVEKSSKSKAEASKKVGYLKALETVAKKWREAGIDAGNWLGVMSPGMSKKFVDYMEYRFSQGDYKNRYTIDTFIRDFGELYKKGYDFKDIKSDFDSFLEKQKQLGKNQKRTEMYGITEDRVNDTWRMFVKGF